MIPALTTIDALINRLPATSAHATEAAAALRTVLHQASEFVANRHDPAAAEAARKHLSETITTAAIQVNSIVRRAREAEAYKATQQGRRVADLGSADAIDDTTQVAIRTARSIAEGAR
jgi:hypothetical protein